MLQDILNAATKKNHDELEELMFVNEIMNKTLSLEQYRVLVATNYIVHAAVEEKVHRALSPELQEKLAVSGRNKLAALEQDLQEMNISKAELDQVPAEWLKDGIDSTASALGAMYVMEGATLGGHVIQKNLQANPAFKDLKLNYYTVYQKALIPNWLSFVEVLNTGIPESGYAAAEQSARQLFDGIARVSLAVKAAMAA